MTRVILNPREEDRLKAGHPWVYDNEIRSVEGPATPGGIVDVESSRKEYLGRGLFSPASKIRVRLISTSKDGIDRGFMKRRLREALERRRRFYDLERESARIVFAEADRLPGLVVDRYVGWPLERASAVLDERGMAPDYEATLEKLGPPDSWLSVQFLCAGMDARKGELLDALTELLGEEQREAGRMLGIPAGIVERDDLPVRELEGLRREEGVVSGTFPETGILLYENGLPFAADLVGGQKTGHFLDQKGNRVAAARFAVDRYGRRGRMLDACCHTGGFSIHAARSGAAELTAVDVSAPALEMVRRNAVLNGAADRLRTIQGNVFDVLRRAEKAGERYSLVVLDPPAFAKSRSALEGAIRGYKELNLRGIRLTESGGVLVTCSCSHAMDETRFKAVIAEAAVDAGRRLRLLEFRTQAPDHPILVGYEESYYLKCGFYEVE